MPDDERQVSLSQVSEFLALARHVAASPVVMDAAQRVAFFERKADLLTRIARQLDTDDAREVAAAARQQATDERARRAQRGASAGEGRTT